MPAALDEGKIASRVIESRKVNDPAFS